MLLLDRVECGGRPGGGGLLLSGRRGLLLLPAASTTVRLKGGRRFKDAVLLARPLNSRCVVTSASAAAAAATRSIMSTLEPQVGYDLVMSLVTLSGALGSLKVFDELAKRDFFDKKMSRKLVHICVGLVFMLFWPLFSDAPRARYLAAIAPMTNALRMIGLGTGLWENKALVKAVSREGHRRELLKGPLYYALTITLATLLFWRNSPVGAVTIANLCAGDGFADIIGRKYGRVKLPYNASKSYVGSLAMLAMSLSVSTVYACLFAGLGYYQLSTRTMVGMVVVSLASTLVESLPISSKLDDNLTVPATSMAVGALVL